MGAVGHVDPGIEILSMLEMRRACEFSEPIGGRSSGSAPLRRALARLLPAVMLSLAATGPVSAQLIPGGRSVDVDQQRAQFLAVMLGVVRPFIVSWQAAWQGESRPQLHEHYANEAFIVQPDGTALSGPAAVSDFADAAVRRTGDALATMLDFDATDGMAYVFGPYSLRPRHADSSATAGRLVTVITKQRSDWRIRAQLFRPDAEAVRWPTITARSELVPLSVDRVARARRNAYRRNSAVLAALRNAWARSDFTAAAGLFTPDAVLMLPGHAAVAGPLILEQLINVRPGFGALHTTELDFESGERLAYLAGRFYVDVRGGPARTGGYVAILRSTGSDWRIRALVFS